MRLHSSMPHWMSPVENCSSPFCLTITDCINTKEKFDLFLIIEFFFLRYVFLKGVNNARNVDTQKLTRRNLRLYHTGLYI